MKLLVYGAFSSLDEIQTIINKTKDDYEYLIVANSTQSNLIIDKAQLNKMGVDFYIVYDSISDLNIFGKQDYELKSLNELVYDTYDYKISVIIPVYNTGKYVQETLNSIINQSIGLQSIQIIIVNDGSTDNSDYILKKYQHLYPDNIKYISKENEGVSVARNIGLKYVKGKYVNFIDSDDKWGLSTFKNVYNFFEKHVDLDVVSTRLSFFDNMVGEHPLNYKYDHKENKVVDLVTEYDHIQMNASSVFFRASAIKDLQFDTTLKYAEDAKFVYNVLKQKFKIGLMSYTQGCYWYRKRNDESSAIDNALGNVEFYNPTIEKFHNYLVEDSGNRPSKYVQMMMLYDLQYRMRYQNITLSTLDNTMLEAYTNKIIRLLKLMDDDVISNPHLKHINAVYQIAILAVKYEGTNFNIRQENGSYNIYSNNIFIKSVSDMHLKTEYIYEKNDILKCGFSLPNINMNIDVTPIILINNREILRPNNESIITEQKFLNKNISYNKFYRFDVDINSNIKQMELKYLINNKILENVKFVSKTTHTNFSNTKIPFKQCKHRTLRLMDNKKILNLRKRRIPVVKNIAGLMKNSNTRKSGIYKTAGIVLKKVNTKKVWLFIDRLDQAGDNAEALFDYVVENRKDVSAYYLINSSSPDYKNMKKKYGNKIVAFNSKKHHLLMFKATKIFTSHSEAYINNPFGALNGGFVRELFDFEMVFLQHGVIQNDLSTLLNKRNKPMDYFITSAPREKEDIVNKYGFTDQEVLLTGLSRFDALTSNVDDTVTRITVMPTWRPHLLEMGDSEFLSSDFFKSIFEFLSDYRIKDLVTQSHIVVDVCLHPRMQERFSKFFGQLEHINIRTHFKYKEVISNTNLLITDVSSIAFDTAYLNKPIIYYHFDIEELYKYSAYIPGYFNYKNDGFGPVVNDAQDLITQIMYIADRGFEMEDYYQERVDKFFAYRDKNNRIRTLNLVEGHSIN